MDLKNKMSAVIAVMLACTLPGAAAKAEENPCKTDVEKFCKDVQPGEGRIIKCIKEHEAELSAECKAKGRELKERAEGIKDACQADLDKFCKDVKLGEGRLARCLKEHKAELSDNCGRKIAEEKEEFMKGHPCAADMEKFCKDVEPGEGRRIKCMKEHEAELSEACKAKIAEKKEEFKEKSPCGPDIDKFCKDVKPGEGRIIACLKQHEAELSVACKAKALEVKEKVDNLKDACQADLDRFCKDMKPGDGRLIKCLKQHGTEVSEPCRAQMRGHKEERKEERKEKRKEGKKDQKPAKDK